MDNLYNGVSICNFAILQVAIGKIRVHSNNLAITVEYASWCKVHGCRQNKLWFFQVLCMSLFSDPDIWKCHRCVWSSTGRCLRCQSKRVTKDQLLLFRSSSFFFHCNEISHSGPISGLPYSYFLFSLLQLVSVNIS